MIAAALAAATLATAGSPAPVATPVGVGLREYRVSIYRPSVRRGRIKLNLTNRGEDVHDIAVRRAGRTVAHSALVRAGGRVALRVRLARTGRYSLVCTVADHAERGMRATLRVRR